MYMSFMLGPCTPMFVGHIKKTGYRCVIDLHRENG